MLLRHSLIYFISRVVTGATALVGIWLFTRLFEPAVYGQYIGCVAFASFSNIIFFDWLRKAYLRKVVGHTAPQRLAGAMLTIFLIKALVIGFIAVGLWLWGSNFTQLAALTLALTLAFALSDLSLEKLRSLLKPAQYVCFSVLRDVTQLALVFVFLAIGFTEHVLLLSQFSAYVLPVVLWAPFLWRGVRLHLARDETEALLGYGLPLIINYALTAFLNNADRLLLTALASASAVGLYGAASGMARQSITLLMQSINLAAAPLAFRAGLDKSGQQATDQLSQNFVLLLAVGLPATVGLSVLAGPICTLVLGPSYAGVAATLLPLVAGAAFLYGMRTFYTDHAYYMSDQTRLLWKNAVFCSLLSIPIYITLILSFGPVGAGWAALINGLIALLTSWFMGQRIFALPLPLRDSAWIVSGSIIMAALVELCILSFGAGWLGIAVAVFTAGIVYSSVMITGNILNLRKLLLLRLGF